MPRPNRTIGLLRHSVTIETALAQPLAVTQLTRAGAVATAQAVAHGYEDDEEIEIAGATQSAYNGRFSITVLDADRFTYPVSGAPATPATGTVTATYISDGQGGQRQAWRTLASTVAADVMPLSGYERVQAAAVAANLSFRVRIWYRDDVTEQMRLLWENHTLQIVGPPIPVDGDKVFMELDCAEAR